MAVAELVTRFVDWSDGIGEGSWVDDKVCWWLLIDRLLWLLLVADWCVGVVW